MWIRTTLGEYVNLDCVSHIHISESKLGGFNIVTEEPGTHCFIARFDNQEGAQAFLDALSRTFGRVIDANMTDWHYSGHEKDRKEKRHGGS